MTACQAEWHSFAQLVRGLVVSPVRQEDTSHCATSTVCAHDASRAQGLQAQNQPLLTLQSACATPIAGTCVCPQALQADSVMGHCDQSREFAYFSCLAYASLATQRLEASLHILRQLRLLRRRFALALRGPRLAAVCAWRAFLLPLRAVLLGAGAIVVLPQRRVPPDGAAEASIACKHVSNQEAIVGSVAWLVKTPCDVLCKSARGQRQPACEACSKRVQAGACEHKDERLATASASRAVTPGASSSSACRLETRGAHEAQLMHPVCTSGVIRCCAARCLSGTRQCDVVPKLWLPFCIASNEHKHS